MATKKNNKCVRNSNLLLSAALVALFCEAGGMRPASAQSVSGTGNLIPGVGAIVSPHWVVGPGGGDELDVGDSAAGSLTISGGGTVSNGNSYVGGASTGVGTVTVSGSDGSGHASTWNSVTARPTPGCRRSMATATSTPKPMAWAQR